MGVFWITGLSGAGKTTIANLVYNKIKLQCTNVIRIDGDVIRDVFGNDCGYSKKDRLTSAYRNARLCKFLSDEGLITICSTISMYDEVRDWNKNNIDDYFEVYLKVPMNELKLRDKKNIYNSDSDTVVTFDNGWHEPKTPDLIIDNTQIEDLNKTVDMILLSCPFQI